MLGGKSGVSAEERRCSKTAALLERNYDDVDREGVFHLPEEGLCHFAVGVEGQSGQEEVSKDSRGSLHHSGNFFSFCNRS